MLLQIKEDVTLVIFPPNEIDTPVKVSLKKGLRVTLWNEELSICATAEQLAFGPNVKIEETKGVDMEERWIGKVFTVPAQFLCVHPQELP